MTHRLTRLGVMIIFALGLAWLAGCSTGMSKEECTLANWQQIGYEDGSVGRNLNYIARHRKSCSKAAVTPDFQAYKRGHAEGLKQWCNYDNGLYLGESGRRYEGICPKSLEPAFLDGYDHGRRLYQARSAVNSIRTDIQNSVHRIELLEEERAELTDLIIAPDTSNVERVKYVARIEEIGDEITDLELYIADREQDLLAAEADLERVRP